MMRRTPIKRGKPLRRTAMRKRTRPGSRVYRDGRIRLSDSDWQRRKNEIWEECEHVCGICGLLVARYCDYELHYSTGVWRGYAR